MKLPNLILLVVALLIHFHGVRSGSAETCQLIDMGGMSSNEIGVDFITTPFTQDKSTLFDVLNNQVAAILETDETERRPYKGINFHLVTDDPAQPQKGGILYTYDWFTNNTIVFNSWFTPVTTGEYTFSIDTANDAAAIYIYDNQDMLCCDDMDLVGWLSKTVEVINIPTDPEHTTGPKSITLQAGKNYLFFIVYVNFSGDAELSISITDPSGQVISDIGPYIGFPQDATCDFIRRTSMVYSLGTDSITTTYSTSYRTTTFLIPGDKLLVTEIETIYYILTPAASSSSEIIPSSSDIQSSSSRELLTSYDSSVIESTSETITSTSEVLSSFDSSVIEISSGIITSSSEVFTSADPSSSSEVVRSSDISALSEETLATSALVSSSLISDVSSSVFSNPSPSDESSASPITSSSEKSMTTIDPSITSVGYSSAFSDDITSSSSIEDVDTNGVLPTSSSDTLSEYSTEDTSNAVSATISDGPEDIKTTGPGGSIYQNSTVVSHSSTVESSGPYYGSSSGLITDSSSTKELDGIGIGSTHSTGGSAEYTVVKTVTNIFGQTTTTVVTCTESACQQTSRADEEHDEPKISSHGGNTVTLSAVVTIDASLATSKQLGVETNIPQSELYSTEKYEGTVVLQAGSNSASNAPTTTFSVVAAPNGSDRNQLRLVASIFSFFFMLLLL
ncbi:hypothetical protein DAKH74_047270 [Maudiozyma humilis]|uniref:PA14 domain-containing protein n=1 Tax=Maudiozyma humilis TaxID=51915 RepID=A0AAV5S311_MAUHU|nr:hypothetical protein DAKH74_047270 [Kazachstania humilis]